MKKKIVQNKSYENLYDYKQCKVWEARSQKFFSQLRGLLWGVWGRSPQRLKILHFFKKNKLVLGLYWEKIMLLKHGIEIGSVNLIKLFA